MLEYSHTKNAILLNDKNDGIMGAILEQISLCDFHTVLSLREHSNVIYGSD